MISFIKSKFQIAKLNMIAFSSALGGSCRYMVDGQEVRATLPFPVARKLTKRFGSRFMYPREFLVVMYNGEIISMDTHTLRSDDDPTIDRGDTTFIAEIRKAVDEINTANWAFDGRFIFKLEPVAKEDQVLLTADGMMRACPATCIDLQGIPGERKSSKSESDSDDDESDGEVIGTRDCILAYGPNGKVFTSPPVWLKMSQIRKSVEALDNPGTFYQLDEISDRYKLSLDFILNTAKVIGYNFGYNAVLPLRIPQLMVSVNTINLAKIDPKSRKRIDSGISVTHAMLYLLGYIEKTTDLQVYMQIKQLLKHTVGRWTVQLSEKKVNSELVDKFNQIELIHHDQLIAQHAEKVA